MYEDMYRGLNVSGRQKIENVSPLMTICVPLEGRTTAWREKVGDFH